MLIKLKLEAESSAHMLLLCSESGPGGPEGTGSSWQDIWLSSNRSSGGGEMLSTGLRLDGVFWGCCWTSPGTTPGPGSPAAGLAPLLILPGAERAPSTPCISEALAPSPPLGWRCWGALGWSETEVEGAVEGPEQGAPMAREEAEGLRVEEVASVVCTNNRVSRDVQHRAG